jgi:hypothetical protein
MLAALSNIFHKEKEQWIRDCFYMESPVKPRRLKVSMQVFDALKETFFAARHSDVDDIVHNESFRCHSSCFRFSVF